MYPAIRYDGVTVRVTPDTAADLVGRGLAQLVEGELPAPPIPSATPSVARVQPKASGKAADKAPKAPAKGK